MLCLAYVSDLLPRICSRECLQSLRIRLVCTACFVIYSSYSSMSLFSSEIFVVLLSWWRHLLVTISSAIALKKKQMSDTASDTHISLTHVIHIIHNFCKEQPGGFVLPCTVHVRRSWKFNYISAYIGHIGHVFLALWSAFIFVMQIDWCWLTLMFVTWCFFAPFPPPHSPWKHGCVYNRRDLREELNCKSVSTANWGVLQTVSV